MARPRNSLQSKRETRLRRLCSPLKIGEYGVETLFKALNGETVPTVVDTGTGLATNENLAQFK